MYSPSTPSYSPSYRPAYAFAPKKAVHTSHHIMFHGSWVVGAIVLGLAVWYTRIAADAMYAQSQMQMYPKLTMFLQTNGGKAVIALMYLVSVALFTGTYKLYMDKIRHLF